MRDVQVNSPISRLSTWSEPPVFDSMDHPNLHSPQNRQSVLTSRRLLLQACHFSNPRKGSPAHHSHEDALSSHFLSLDIPNDMMMKLIRLALQPLDLCPKHFLRLDDSTQKKCD
ncbi:hypothetical protein N7516_010547 [Penicillium verrucosum]|uniref:uncharacterized protein n=1 Tax=Penicillium verrucosum TaxID=60171 RepID=UPI002544EBE5|nr:uncharacterized protein N7516_010547 [Penicillium verrucosum]KAJ5922844.1 hypothetical protein N7516_010547 [Penicillium verrucosum]